MNKQHKPALLVRALPMNIVKMILLEIGVGVRATVIIWVGECLLQKLSGSEI